MQTVLTSKGQMTLPVAVRDRMGLSAGDKLTVTMQDAETIVLKRPTPPSSAGLRGLLAKRPHGTKKPLTVEEMDAGIAAHLSEKNRKG
jgi:antitoxin PrlF